MGYGHFAGQKRLVAVVMIVATLIGGGLFAPGAHANPTVPGFPTMQSAVAGDQSATITWIAPTDGGSPIDGYKVTVYPVGKASTVQTVTPTGCPGSCTATVTGLLNGTSYTFTVTAHNSLGYGQESVHSNAVTPSGKPFAPTGVSATGGNATATVQWNAADSNGSDITSYTVNAYIGTTLAKSVTGITCSDLTCSTSITGLVNGSTYTFTVTALNNNGSGTESAPSAAVKLGIPDAPTNVQATAGNTTATVSWMAPANNNGAVISSYTVTVYAGNSMTIVKTVPANTTSLLVTNLTNGSQYSFTVKATNSRGIGPESTRSNVVTVGAPSAPTSVSASPGDTQATVTWIAANSNGGTPPTYTVRAYTILGGVNTAVVTVSGVSCSNPSCSYVLTGLTNGTTYTFTVSATNGSGDGPESAPSSAVVPAGRPAAPAIGTATAGASQATVTWTADSTTASNGSAVISYVVRAYTGGNLAATVTGVTCSTTPCTATVTGLTNGTAYTFRVAAVNGVGEGSQSDASNPVTPVAVVPGAPTIGTATPGNQKAFLTWTAPTSDGGSPISSYKIRVYAGNVEKTPMTVSCSGGTCPTSATITGLTNGTSYTFTVSAVNATGPSSESAHSNSVVPGLIKPPAPTIGTATNVGTGVATVTWTAPPDLGLNITSYTIRAYANAAVIKTLTLVACTTTPCTATITGLPSGVNIGFKVAAVNAQGEGPESELSNIVNFTGAPDAPSNVHATAGDSSAVVTWSAPAHDGGSAITGYTVTLTASGVTVVQHVGTGGTLQATFTGLTNNTTYDVAVVAVTNLGTSLAAHTSVTPLGITPGAPISVNAAAAVQSATVSWSAPSTGALSVTSYTVTVYDGSSSTVITTANVSGTTTSTTITGLKNGATYTFTVTATNIMGKGPESGRSNSITLPNVPGAPTAVQATSGTGQATVNWTAPSSNGGSTITSYIVTAQSSGNDTEKVTVGGDHTSAIMTGLTPGNTYTFTVIAVNALGQSPASGASSSLTIPTLPGTPVNLVVTAQNGGALVSWGAPSSDGGKPITGYQVTVSDGKNSPTTLTPTSTSVTLTGLTNGVTYTITVIAINSIGHGGSVSTAVTPTSGPPSTTQNSPPTLNLPGDQSVRYGHTLSFDMSAGDADSGDHLTLTAAGLPSGLTFVDKGNGKGSVSGSVSAGAGTYAAVFTVDDGHNPAVSHPLTITVTTDTATLSPVSSNATSVKVKTEGSLTGKFKLDAVVSGSDNGSNGDIAKAVPVTCTLRSMNSGAIFTSDASIKAGAANTLTSSCSFRGIPVDVYRVRFQIGGNYYTGSTTDYLTVYGPTKATVKASGTIMHAGVSSTFKITAGFIKGGKVQGSIVYTEHRASGDVTLTSNLVGGLVFKAHKAYLQGTATLNGSGQYTIVATILNNKYRKAKDRVGIRVVTGHQVFSDLSFAPVELATGKASVVHS